MKTLKDFIKESQEINESLFGDIVRKLLDTGLSWIGSSAKFIADQVVNATAEIWKTNKQAFIDIYSDFRRSHPEYKDILPARISNQQDMATAYSQLMFNPSIDAKYKIEEASKHIKSYKNSGGKPGAVAAQVSRIAADCYNGICSNPNASNTDKQLAEKFLKDVISMFNDDEVKELIEDRIKDFNSKVK